MAIVDFKVKTLAELVGTVLELQTGLGSRSFLWFRGIACSRYPLLPSLLRDGRSWEEVMERENRLLMRFRQRSVAYWPTGYSQDNWEHLFAMEHHGVPTRLLNWTENLFVAAYFALWKQAVHNSAKHKGRCTPAIWCVDPVQWNRAMPGLSEYGDSIHVLTTTDEELKAHVPMSRLPKPKSPVAIYGTSNSSRIVAQRGTFMVWGSDVSSLEVVANKHDGANLWRMCLTGKRADLLRDLQTLGISETMIVPELETLACELARMEGWK